LFNPETVLFVDNNQTQVGELHLLPQQRVSSHNQVRLTRRCHQERFFSLRSRQRAGE